MFWDNILVPLQGSRSPRRVVTLEDGTDILSQNIGKGLPLYTALYPRRAQISSALQQNHEITERSGHVDIVVYYSTIVRKVMEILSL
jgi:hypothetical protein